MLVRQYRLTLIIPVILLAAMVASATEEGSDTGLILAGPQVPDERTKTLANGNTLQAFTQRGVVFSDNPASPWHQASFLAAGESVTNSAGNVVKEVVFFEMTDPNGDVSWSCILRDRSGGPGTFSFVFGTGKWKWIVGEGELMAPADGRGDDHVTPRYRIDWRLDPEAQKKKHLTPIRPEDWQGYDTAFSFHGPHAVRKIRDLANGTTLILNDQAGVLIGENPLSPVYRSTMFTTTTEVVMGDPPEVVIHVGWGEWIDSDGDIFWIAGVDSYPDFGVVGTTTILGGTGKWQGIEGLLRFDGAIRPRGDDHNLVKWEIGWNVE